MPGDKKITIQSICRIAMGSILFLAWLTIVYPLRNAMAEPCDSKLGPCDLHREDCHQALPGGIGVVTLGIYPKPIRAMTDLRFTVTISGVECNTPPYIDLEMPEMKMGPNRVRLKPSGQGVYTGTGVIVRCPSGRTLWEAIINVPDAGSARFEFDAVY